MRLTLLLALFFCALTLCGCLQTGYSQPTYVISDGVEEEELAPDAEAELR